MDQPLLVTVAIIMDGDKFLLVRRAKDPFKGCWSFVGGCGAFRHVSDPVEAVKEEVVADVNCKFDPTFFTYNQAEFEVSTVTLFFCGPIEGEPVINPKEVLECKWFSAEEALSLDLSFDANLILRKYLNEFPQE